VRLLGSVLALVLAGAAPAFAQGDVVVRFEGARASGAFSATSVFGGSVVVPVSEMADAFGEFVQEFGHEYGRDSPVAPPGAGLAVVYVIFLTDITERIDRSAAGGVRLHLPGETTFRPFGSLAVSRWKRGTATTIPREMDTAVVSTQCTRASGSCFECAMNCQKSQRGTRAL
jgi:hypothetical protein